MTLSRASHGNDILPFAADELVGEFLRVSDGSQERARSVTSTNGDIAGRGADENQPVDKFKGWRLFAKYNFFVTQHTTPLTDSPPSGFQRRSLFRGVNPNSIGIVPALPMLAGSRPRDPAPSHANDNDDWSEVA